MTDDDQVLAKVRSAAEAIERAQASLPARRDRVPADDTFSICARVALAMVEQVTWLREAAGAHREAAKSAPVGDFEAHPSAAAAYDVARERMESAPRTAVASE